MKITIINGNSDTQNKQFDHYIDALDKELKKESHSSEVYTLRDMDLKYCTGCFNCWIKTPGECFQKDDTRSLRRSAIQSDFILLASPIIMGFTTALLKKCADKFLPLLLPFATLVENELHHEKRYDRYPPLGLLLERSPHSDDEDIKIITDIYKRNALNFRSSLSFNGFIGDPVREAAHAINHI
jgi:multimeric flavodoxin WrbA